MSRSYQLLSSLNDNGFEPVILENYGNLRVSGSAKLCASQDFNYVAGETGTFENTSSDTDNYTYYYAYTNNDMDVTTQSVSYSPFVYVPYSVN